MPSSASNRPSDPVPSPGAEPLTGGLGVLVLEEVANSAAILVGDRLVDRDRVVDEHGAHLLDLRQRQPGVLGQLFAGGLAPEGSLELAPSLVDLVVGVDHVDRESDLTALVRDRTADRVADPPAPVGREPEALAIVEAIDRLHQADVALLDEVLKRHPPVVEASCDRDHEPEVGLDEGVLRGPQAPSGPTDVVRVGREGLATIARRLDREGQAVARARHERLDVTGDLIGHDIVGVEVEQTLGEREDRRIEGVLVGPSLTIPEVARGLANRTQLLDRDLVRINPGFDHLHDAVHERRVGEDRQPVLLAEVEIRVAAASSSSALITSRSDISRK
jgi:hypothetical protein